MSGFPPDRNVRFHGLLQGCSAGTWYLGLLWFLGFGVRSASPGGRRPEGLVERCAGSGQARRVQISPSVAQPVASVQAPFDLDRSSTKPRTYFFPQYSPAIPVPAYGVVLSHFAGHAYTQDFFQALFLPQSSMGIAGIPRCYRKTLLPLGNKARLQKVIGGLDAVDSRQAHLLHQAVLKSFKQSLDTPFGLSHQLHVMQTV